MQNLDPLKTPAMKPLLTVPNWLGGAWLRIYRNMAIDRYRYSDEPTANCAYTYDVVAYNASWGGYGDNASKEGFESAEAAIAYAKSCGAHLNATAWKRTIPIPVERVSVQIYPAEKSSEPWSCKCGAPDCPYCGYGRDQR